MSGITLTGAHDVLDQPKAAQKPRRYRGPQEAALRDAVDLWGRARWPDARVCHELVMDRGTVRLDVAFVCPATLVTVELKSGFDTMERAIHQVAMATLASHEVWLICAGRYAEDMRLIHYLLPNVGIADHSGPPGQEEIKVLAEAAPRVPHPVAQASLLWVAELARALGVGGPRPGSHAQLARRLAALPPEDRDALVCRELRGRNALWRADDPVPNA
jgi:hypothetical protein